MSEHRSTRIKPAVRNEAGECIDLRCTRMGSNIAKGDRGRCVGYHCPLCDTPTGMMGHRCPMDPVSDVGGPGLAASASGVEEQWYGDPVTA